MLPKPLYDALPWMYMTFGAITTALLESDLKFLPAVLFFLAGCLVLAFRFVPRPEQRRVISCPADKHKVDRHQPGHSAR